MKNRFTSLSAAPTIFPNSNLGKVVAEYINVLRANDFKINDSVEEFYRGLHGRFNVSNLTTSGTNPGQSNGTETGNGNTGTTVTGNGNTGTTVTGNDNTGNNIQFSQQPAAVLPIYEME